VYLCVCVSDRQTDGKTDKQASRQSDTHTDTQIHALPSIMHRQNFSMPNFDTFQITTFALLTPFVKDNCKYNVLSLPKKQQS
jgi:hypothetical protein